MDKERRKSENIALRELVDALKTVIEARDALWSLSPIDRMFRLDKYKQVISSYDDAMLGVRNAIRELMQLTTAAPAESAPSKQTPRPGISMEEFEVLLGKPGAPKSPKKPRATPSARAKTQPLL